MNRLRDDVGDDPVAERGIEMLRDCAATPSLPDMKRKVWGAIQQQRLRAATPRPLRHLRVAAAFAVVLCLAGTAGAVLSQRWIKFGRSPVIEEQTTGVAPTHVRTHARAPLRSTRTVTAPGVIDEAAATAALAKTPALAPEAVAVAKPATRQVRKAERSGGRAHGVSAKPASVLANLSAASVGERTEVLDALVALRRDGDAERAGLLLDGYLGAHPQGVLREEAMVLSIEAADARGDGSAARRLARAYQATYPGGRFAAFARARAASQP